MVRYVVMADGALPDPEPPAPTDERLPLNKRQVFKLQKSWKGIKRNMAATGLEMFVSMFRSHEDTKPLFAKFRHIEDEVELRTNDALEEHGNKVMDVIDDVITNIENVDYVLAKLGDVGLMHCTYMGFTAQFFWRIEEPFLKAVKLTLGDRYTDNMDSIYKIVIKFVLGELTKGAKGEVPDALRNGDNAVAGAQSQNARNITTDSGQTGNAAAAAAAGATDAQKSKESNKTKKPNAKST